METGTKVLFVFVEGNALPEQVDENAIYFVKGTGELFLGEAKIADSKNLKFIGTGAGFHNSIYRGKNLGTSVTAEQYAAIKAGTFDDLYIGDYWVIDGITWRIAAFDYYYQTGDTACTSHHVVIVPDGTLGDAAMNAEATTTGGYYNSQMYTEGLSDAKAKISQAFGDAHILKHRQYLVNATSAGHPSAGSWYDSTVELMTEQNVYGCKIFGPIANGSTVYTNYTIDKSQYPLFRLDPESAVSNQKGCWLRDVVSDTLFAYVGARGSSHAFSADGSYGIRPAFSIVG